MAVDVIAPDTRKKVDELFLYWLSEPSTQKMLRNELASLCGLQSQQQQSPDLVSPNTPSCVVAKKPGHRPSSPNAVHTAISPTPPVNRSPKSTSPKSSTSSLRQQAPKTISQAPVPADDSAVTVETDSQESKPRHEQQGAVETPSVSPLPVAPSTAIEIIPAFYFPNGRRKADENTEQLLESAEKIFQRYPRQEISREDFSLVVKVSVRDFSSVSLKCSCSINKYIAIQ